MSPTQRDMSDGASTSTGRSNKSRNQRASRNHSDDECESSQSSSKRNKSLTPRFSQSQQGSISGETLERLTHNCIRYILVLDQKKVPIKRPDIVKNVLKEHSKAFNEVMDCVVRKLRQVFGFSLVELKKGSFILVNELECTTELASSRSPSESSKQGFLFIVLALIFMNGQVITEEELWKILKKFGLPVDVPHDLLGDVKKLLTGEFVSQLYLEYKIRPGIDPPEHEFLWGQRAEQEVSKMEVLDFVCKVYKDGRKPEDWASQFRDAAEQVVSDD